MPYDHRNITPGVSTSSLMDLVLRELNHLHFEDKCLVGSGGGTLLMAPQLTICMMSLNCQWLSLLRFMVILKNPIDKHVFNKTVNNWTAAFLTLFERGTLLLGDAHFAPSTDLRKWVPFGDRVTDGNLVGEIEDKMDGLELGMQDICSCYRLCFYCSCSALGLQRANIDK